MTPYDATPELLLDEGLSLADVYAFARTRAELTPAVENDEEALSSAPTELHPTSRKVKILSEDDRIVCAADMVAMWRAS